MNKYKVSFYSDNDTLLGIQLFDSGNVHEINENIRTMMVSPDTTWIEIIKGEKINCINKEKIARYTVAPSAIEVLK